MVTHCIAYNEMEKKQFRAYWSTGRKRKTGYRKWYAIVYATRRKENGMGPQIVINWFHLDGTGRHTTSGTKKVCWENIAKCQPKNEKGVWKYYEKKKATETKNHIKIKAWNEMA